MNNTTTGVTVLDVLAIIFIVLKLVGVINWSWWWVLSPIWISIILIIVIIIIMFVLKKR